MRVERVFLFFNILVFFMFYGSEFYGGITFFVREVGLYSFIMSLGRGGN